MGDKDYMASLHYSSLSVKKKTNIFPLLFVSKEVQTMDAVEGRIVQYK